MKAVKDKIEYLKQFLTEGQLEKCERFFTGKYDVNILKLIERTLKQNKESSEKLQELKNKQIEDAKIVNDLHYKRIEELKSEYESKIKQLVEDFKSSIPINEYEVRKRLDMLEALEIGGVDNWEWYGESLTGWSEKYK